MECYCYIGYATSLNFSPFLAEIKVSDLRQNFAKMYKLSLFFKRYPFIIKLSQKQKLVTFICIYFTTNILKEIK